jgi:hypothetical protein
MKGAKGLLVVSLVNSAVVGQFGRGARAVPAVPGLSGWAAKLGWAMHDELERQLRHIERLAAEILDAVKSLHAAQAATGEINARLRRFLERKK